LLARIDTFSGRASSHVGVSEAQARLLRRLLDGHQQYRQNPLCSARAAASASSVNVEFGFGWNISFSFFGGSSSASVWIPWFFKQRKWRYEEARIARQPARRS
jgi:hypothetical protein